MRWPCINWLFNALATRSADKRARVGHLRRHSNGWRTATRVYRQPRRGQLGQENKENVATRRSWWHQVNAPRPPLFHGRPSSRARKRENVFLELSRETVCVASDRTHVKGRDLSRANHHFTSLAARRLTLASTFSMIMSTENRTHCALLSYLYGLDADRTLSRDRMGFSSAQIDSLVRFFLCHGGRRRRGSRPKETELSAGSPHRKKTERRVCRTRVKFYSTSRATGCFLPAVFTTDAHNQNVTLAVLVGTTHKAPA